MSFKIMVEILRRNRAVGTPSRKWEGNIKMNLTELKYEGVDLLQLA
jgi:hypothetical protein